MGRKKKINAELEAGREEDEKLKKDLPEGFADAIDSMSRDEIRKRICDVTILDMEYRAKLKEDGAVNQAKAELKELMEPYRADFRSVRAQLKYAKHVLDGKGGAPDVQGA